MDKWQALHAFWSSFGLPAYDENTVPTGNQKPAYPYITYGAAAAGFGSPVALSASLWYYGVSWAPVTAKLAEIESRLLHGGRMVPCDGGALWIKPGSPFAQRMSDPNDMIRRIFINVEAEFITV